MTQLISGLFEFLCVIYNIISLFYLDVEHYILWKLNEAITVQDIEEAIDSFKSNYIVLNSVYYINPPHLKSIPEIEHAHIIFQLNR